MILCLVQITTANIEELDQFFIKNGNISIPKERKFGKSQPFQFPLNIPANDKQVTKYQFVSFPRLSNITNTANISLQQRHIVDISSTYQRRYKKTFGHLKWLPPNPSNNNLQAGKLQTTFERAKSDENDFDANDFHSPSKTKRTERVKRKSSRLMKTETNVTTDTETNFSALDFEDEMEKEILQVDLTKSCRTKDGRYLPPNVFKVDSCASCYLFETKKKKDHGTPMPWNLTQLPVINEKEVFLALALLNNTENNHTEFADPDSASIFEAVTDEEFRTRWKTCCEAALKCCAVMSSTPPSTVANSCPRTWDGWQCWTDAEPGTTSYEPCPSYSYIVTVPSCTKMASKECHNNGTWLHRRGLEWSNYSLCGTLSNVRLRIQWHIGALTMSAIALIPALLIFSYYRQLHVHRITLHKQLFLSLLLKSVCSISFRLIELYGIEHMQKSSPWCIGLSIIRMYVSQTNYTWYFCEGFYLHKLLASAFAEQRSLLVYYLIGWVFPVFPVLLYALVRGLVYDTAHCWNMPIEHLEWIIHSPPLLAILINFMFMVNIMRILVGKVRATHGCSDPSQYRMAVRATMIVVPLFGLQYIITIYRPNKETCSWVDAYHIINNIIDGSTGFIVAIIFCYVNSEVQAAIKRSWAHFQDRQGFAFPEQLQRSFRLRSLSTVQTTLVDMNAQTLTRRNSSSPSLFFKTKGAGGNRTPNLCKGGSPYLTSSSPKRRNRKNLATPLFEGVRPLQEDPYEENKSVSEVDLNDEFGYSSSNVSRNRSLCSIVALSRDQTDSDKSVLCNNEGSLCDTQDGLPTYDDVMNNPTNQKPMETSKV